MPVFILPSKRGKQIDYEFPNYGNPVPLHIEASGKIDIYIALTENIQEAIKEDSKVQRMKYLDTDKLDETISFPWSLGLAELYKPQKWSIFIGNKGMESVAVYFEVKKTE